MTLDGKFFTGSSLDGITWGDQHKLVVDAPGYAEQSFTFIGTPFEKKHFDVTLEKDRERKAAKSTINAPPPPVAAAPAGNGKLNVGATGGWCNVTVDGAARGATPVAGLELSAGMHKVSCTTADGKTQSATVSVPVDGTARQKFTLTP
jgi:serine/threonine-protein kinase